MNRSRSTFPLLHPSFRLLACRQVANDPGEVAFAVQPEFTEADQRGDLVARLMKRREFDAVPVNMFLAGVDVRLKPGLVGSAESLRNNGEFRSSDQFVGRISEYSFDRGVAYTIRLSASIARTASETLSSSSIARSPSSRSASPRNAGSYSDRSSDAESLTGGTPFHSRAY